LTTQEFVRRIARFVSRIHVQDYFVQYGFDKNLQKIAFMCVCGVSILTQQT